ncbi:MAG: hypothetical protein WCE23_17455 [Candidatus Binatus sp.]|uniref:hypothetical protein n=1 Tax=Candidatus Binatus sp. TaxID=2811406 RepID=UPI003C72A140
MSTFAVLAGSVLVHKGRHSVPGLGLIAAVLAFSLIALPADRAVAYQSGGALPSVGSVDDYMSQGQPRDREYAPQGPNMAPGGQGFYGAPTGSRSQINPAVIGAAVIIGLWALQRYEEHHQRHAMRNARRSRDSRGLDSGNPIPSPLGYGF